jgi:hypothetical protein
LAISTLQRTGQVNAGGSATALFYQKLIGEVLGTFQETNVMMPKHMVRTISKGKSAAFPVTGTASAAYHTAGAELTGSAINHNEKVVSIDSKLIAHVWVADIDEAMQEWEVRQHYSSRLGRALALTADQQLCQLACLAARASATITGGNGGSQLTNANYLTVGADLAAGVFSAAQKLDEKDVPAEDRFCVLRPAQYYLLAQTTSVINKDWNGAGSYADGRIIRIAGVEIVKSNNFPRTDKSGDSATGQNNTYLADFSNSAFAVFHKEAIATVKLMDLKMGNQWYEDKQATILTASYAMGHNILRPECAIEGKVA